MWDLNQTKLFGFVSYCCIW